MVPHGIDEMRIDISSVGAESIADFVANASQPKKEVLAESGDIGEAEFL